MAKLNKTAQILRIISRKNICSLADLSRNQLLMEQYSNTRSTTPARRITDACSLLAKKGYITVGTVDNDKVFKITQKGQLHLQRNAVLEAHIDTSSWDSRWYLVTFDITEQRKTVRNQLILSLKRHGFLHYSKGLWVLPYNPIKMLDTFRDQYGLKSEIKMIVASHLEGEAKLKRHFKLTS